MEKTMLPGRRRALLLALSIPALLLAIASLPWRGGATSGPPRLTARAIGSGPLSAGAGEAAFDLPDGAPIAGFPRPLRWGSVAPAGPVGARALVLEAPGCRVAVVSAELLVVPAALEEAVRTRVADLRLDGLLVGATHTHAGPGGYWDDPLAEAIGTGPFQADLARRIEEGIERAVRAAAAALAPARAGAARVDAGTLVRNRDGGAKDGLLTVVRLERLDGAPVAEVAVLGAHATFLGKRNRSLSGDWPGRFMAERPHGPRLFLQGTIGDQSAEVPSPAPRDLAVYAASVSALAAGARVTFPAETPVALAYARAEVALPAFAPGALPAWLRPAARTLLGGLVPAAAPVSALRLGPALLVAVPGEPVAAVTAAWRGRPGLADATFVSLADGYVGYAETASRFEAREGEAVRAYLGAELAERLGEGAEVAVAALGRD